MKPFLSLLSTALCVSAFGQAPTWMPYASKLDGFSIQMPVTPQVHNQVTEGVTTHIHMAITSPVVCAVSKTLLPKGFKQADVEGIKKGMVQGMLRTSGGTATGEKIVAYGGMSGRQTNFKLANGGSGAMWVSYAPGMVYSLTIARPAGATEAEMKKFFGSFKRKL